MQTKNKPLVSIIIPVYNRENLIIETLKSIQSQNYTNWECILVDDHSTDKTLEVIKEFSTQDNRFIAYKRPDNLPKGANACRNFGYKNSSGEIINYFDSDDLMHPSFLSKHISNIISNKLDLSISDYLVFDSETGETIKEEEHQPIISKNLFQDFIERKVIFHTTSAVIKKEFLNNINLKYNEELQAAQEWEYFSKMLYYKPRTSAIYEKLTFIREHNQSITYGGDHSKRLYQYYLARKYLQQFLLEKNIKNKYLEKYSHKRLTHSLYDRDFYFLKKYIYNEFKILGFFNALNYLTKDLSIILYKRFKIMFNKKSTLN